MSSDNAAYRSGEEHDHDESSDDGESSNAARSNQNEVDECSTKSNYDSDENQADRNVDADTELNQIAAEVGGISLGSDQATEEKKGGDQQHQQQQEQETEQEQQQQQQEQDSDDLYDYEDTPTLRTLARWIRSGEASKILVLSGAGVSCSAGIPDFRTPGTGLYDNLSKYNLPYPEVCTHYIIFCVCKAPICE